VAIEPSRDWPLPDLEKFCGQVDGMRSQGLFRWARVVSILHPDQYPYPNAWFQSMKFQLRRKAEAEIHRLLSGRLLYQHLSVLISGGSNTEEMVEIVSRTARKKRADLLVLSWDGRESLWSRLFGGFAQSAISYASVPVLVIRPGIDAPARGREILAAVDAERLPSAAELRTLMRVARQMSLPLKMLYVRPAEPRGRHVVDASLKLRRLCRYFSTKGIEADWEIVAEEKSVEHSINSYAAMSGADLLVAFYRGRGWFGHLSRGSTVYRLLSQSCRPVLVVRGGA
jgi:nucleotide-binding universal stress UspA family protein